jgi:hypothetical protein
MRGVHVLELGLVGLGWVVSPGFFLGGIAMLIIDPIF